MSPAALLAALALGAPMAEPPGRVAQADMPVAVLRGLDKFSGLTTTFEAAVGAPSDYARLTVIVRACRRTDEGADSAAYLEIVDRKAPDALAFAGWMVASSPAVSALDHPRYDIWLLDCGTGGEAS